MLQACQLSNPISLWNKFRDHMAEDFLNRVRRENRDVQVEFSDEIYNQALLDLENKIQEMGGIGLETYGLPKPVRQSEEDLLAKDIIRELAYDTEELSHYVEHNESLLTSEQQEAFNKVVRSLEDSAGSIFFLDAPGGTGKTFITNLLLAKVRKSKNIALAVASSGIASTLLDGGRTAHATFKLPLDLARCETPMCNISKRSAKAKLLQQTKLIVWDEATMSHKHAFEALDRTLQDLKNNDQLMGGVTVVLSGDFRQTLPVIPRSTPADEIRASLKSSYLWNKIQRISLTTNMRVHLYRDEAAGIFSEQLLQVGNGDVIEDSNNQITLPFGEAVKDRSKLIDKVFPNLEQHYQQQDWLTERAILAPKNDVVNKINQIMLMKQTGQEKLYKSVDTVVDPNQATNYPTEFLNSLELAGMPPHQLKLKVGAPIMLLRNLDPPKLCNGTRLTIKNMMPHLLEATIMNGREQGENVFIPRIPIIPSDQTIEFKRLQFPVKLSYAMTINKSQGQSLKVVGLDLSSPVFSHGQLYVGCSRTGNPRELYYLTTKENNQTKNVVYKEALRN